MKLKTIIMATLALCLSSTANAQLNNPNGLTFDKDGNLWVANYGANQVLEIDPSNGTVLKTLTDYVNGPTRLAFDSLGNLWVANTTNPGTSELPLTHMATFTSPTMRKTTSSF
jgi:DNA-binding beta-propeller fold protein YncE